MSGIQQITDGIYKKYRDVDDGAVATYIAELSKANPKDFGICIATNSMDTYSAPAIGNRIALRVDHAVLRSETITGHRNRALAYLLRNFEILDEHLTEALDQHFA